MRIQTLPDVSHERFTMKCKCGELVDKTVVSTDNSKVIYICKSSKCLKDTANKVSDHDDSVHYERRQE